MAILAGSGLETSLPDRMYGNNDVRGNGANAESSTAMPPIFPTILLLMR